MEQDKAKLMGLMPGSEGRARSYAVVLLFFITVAIIFESAFNYLVNPYGIYDPPPLITRQRESRFIKAKLLAKADPKPQMLILGSSHIRSIDPVYASSLFKLPAFNAGINGAQPRDWLSLTRYAVEGLGYPIQIVLVGVDYSSLMTRADYIYDPVYVSELRPYVRHRFFSWLASRKYLLSPYQFNDSCNNFIKWLKRKPRLRSLYPRVDKDERNLYRPDGFSKELPKPNLRRFERNLTKVKKIYKPLGSIDKEDMADLKKLIEFANSRGITLIFFLTPEMPELEEKLSDTPYAQVKKQSETILKRAAGPRVTFCDIAPSSIDFSDYTDWTHSGLETGRRLVDFAYQCYQDEARK